MPEMYTAKEVAAALAWKDDLCEKRAADVYDGKREREERCDGCPIGYPCSCRAEDGMENILLKWKEAKANESA